MQKEREGHRLLSPSYTTADMDKSLRWRYTHRREGLGLNFEDLSISYLYTDIFNNLGGYGYKIMFKNE